MSTISRVLGQTNAGASLTVLYAAADGVSATVSVNVCNTGIFAESYRISVAVGGASDNPKQYLVYDKVIAANSSDSLGGIYLRPGDVVRVYSSDTNIAFTAMGTESN